MLFLLILISAVARAANTTVPAFQPALAERLFPELTSFWSKNNHVWPPAAYDTIQALQQARQQRMAASVNCTPKPNCTIEAFKISTSDSTALDAALNVSEAPSSLLQVWPQYINATNRLLSVYGQGATPLYPLIDAISYPDNSSGDYFIFLETLATWQRTEATAIRMPPWDAIDIGLTLLDANNRDNALNYPDLWQRENAPALARSQDIFWDQYKYSAIVILGKGPELYDVPLSPSGKIRIRIAVAEFNKGNVAPFLIPSGGNNHPNRTIYTEALIMGRWMIDQYGIANSSIALEPISRHTTTNLRNSARILRTLNAPKDKPVLIITDTDQRDYVGGDVFARRCIYELGYSTGMIGPKIGDFAIEWLPNDQNQLVDPIDPLDP